MKTCVLIVLLYFSHGCSFGQELTNSFLANFGKETPKYVPQRTRVFSKREILYLELGGSGGFGSFNFERTFTRKEKFRWMFRAGISGTYIDKNNGAAIIFPVMVHCVYGQNHGLDVGLGQALTITTRGGIFLRTPLSIGYRLEPKNSRVFYRFSYTPIVSNLVDFQWQHWGGISIGYKLMTKMKEWK